VCGKQSRFVQPKGLALDEQKCSEVHSSQRFALFVTSVCMCLEIGTFGPGVVLLVCLFANNLFGNDTWRSASLLCRCCILWFRRRMGSTQMPPFTKFGSWPHHITRRGPACFQTLVGLALYWCTHFFSSVSPPPRGTTSQSECEIVMVVSLKCFATPLAVQPFLLLVFSVLFDGARLEKKRPAQKFHFCHLHHHHRH